MNNLNYHQLPTPSQYTHGGVQQGLEDDHQQLRAQQLHQGQQYPGVVLQQQKDVEIPHHSHSQIALHPHDHDLGLNNAHRPLTRYAASLPTPNHYYGEEVNVHNVNGGIGVGVGGLGLGVVNHHHNVSVNDRAAIEYEAEREAIAAALDTGDDSWTNQHLGVVANAEEEDHMRRMGMADLQGVTTTTTGGVDVGVGIGIGGMRDTLHHHSQFSSPGDLHRVTTTATGGIDVGIGIGEVQDTLHHHSQAPSGDFHCATTTATGGIDLGVGIGGVRDTLHHHSQVLPPGDLHGVTATTTGGVDMGVGIGGMRDSLHHHHSQASTQHPIVMNDVTTPTLLHHVNHSSPNQSNTTNVNMDANVNVNMGGPVHTNAHSYTTNSNNTSNHSSPSRSSRSSLNSNHNHSSTRSRGVIVNPMVRPSMTNGTNNSPVHPSSYENVVVQEGSLPDASTTKNVNTGPTSNNNTLPPPSTDTTTNGLHRFDSSNNVNSLSKTIHTSNTINADGAIKTSAINNMNTLDMETTVNSSVPMQTHTTQQSSHTNIPIMNANQQHQTTKISDPVATNHTQVATKSPTKAPQVSPQAQAQRKATTPPVQHKTLKHKIRKDFDHRLKELKQYKLEHGDCMVPHKYAKNPSLGTCKYACFKRILSILFEVACLVIVVVHNGHMPGSTCDVCSYLVMTLDIITIPFLPHSYLIIPRFISTGVDTQRRRYRALVKRQQSVTANEESSTSGAQENPVLLPTNTTMITEGAEATCTTANTITKQKTTSSAPITQEQVKKLLEIGFVFEPRLSREETWNKRILEITNFKATHGHCNVREDDQDNPGLGKWVSYVRRQYRLQNKGKREKGRRLTHERISQLLSIGFVFELKEELARVRFREGMEMLRKYYKEEGHTNVPTFYAKNPTFGLIVEDIRKEYRKICTGKTSGAVPRGGKTNGVTNNAAPCATDARTIPMIPNYNGHNITQSELVNRLKETFTTGSVTMSDEMALELMSMDFIVNEKLTPPKSVMDKASPNECQKGVEADTRMETVTTDTNPENPPPERKLT